MEVITLQAEVSTICTFALRTAVLLYPSHGAAAH